MGSGARLLNAPSMENRIKHLREARGWSMRELASRANASASTINNLEKGNVRLNLEWIERLARIFGVEPTDIVAMGELKAAGFSEDVQPFDLKPGRTDIPAVGENEFIYQVRTRALDHIGIYPDDLLIVSIADGFLERLKNGDVVIAQAYEGDKSLDAKTVLRQFLKPGLLVTNSSEDNPAPIVIGKQDASIKGVVTAVHRIIGSA